MRADRKGTHLFSSFAGVRNDKPMPRRPRVYPAKTCCHVLNRAVARLPQPLIEKRKDYEAFERVFRESRAREHFRNPRGG